ncbi:MAG TPA: S41 family peptidase [Thermotogota bacterium]|nr:S41 family peptidase [Thermotogota bacterium]
MRRARLFPFFVLLELVLLASPVLAQPVAAIELEGLVQRYVQATGAAEAWQDVRTLRMVVEQQSFGSVQTLELWQDLRTGAMLLQGDMPPLGQVTLAFDGEDYWMETAFYRGYLDESEELVRLLQDPSLSASDGLLPVDPDQLEGPVSTATVDGRTFYVARMKKQPGETTTMTLFFDTQDFLVKRAQISGFRMMGLSIPLRMEFSDFQTVEGLLLPMRTSTSSWLFRSQSHILELQLNPKLPKGLFAFSDSSPEPQPWQDELAESYELVTEKILSSFPDPSFDPGKWEELVAQNRSAALECTTPEELRDVLNEMLSTLGVSHCQVLPPGWAVPHPEYESPPLTLRWLETGVVAVTAVAPEFPREMAILPGMELHALNGKSLDAVLSAFPGSPGFPPPERVSVPNRVYRAIQDSLRQEGTVELSFHLPDTTVHLDRQSFAFRGAPEFTYRKLTPSTGYILLPGFMEDITPEWEKALAAFSDCTGLVIDLRANPGGQMLLATALADSLLDSEATLGNLVFRYEDSPYTVPNNSSVLFPGKVVLLVDALTASAAECFALGLQKLDPSRFTIVGQRSAGLAVLSRLEELPDGDLLQLPVGLVFGPNGENIEGNGVVPDHEVPLSVRKQSPDLDPVLENGISLLGSMDSR